MVTDIIQEFDGKIALITLWKGLTHQHVRAQVQFLPSVGSKDCDSHLLC